MQVFKYPGVYVHEVSIIPPSVSEVGSAVPAFIGYTKSAQRHVPDDLHLKPTKVSSILEFEQLFGSAPSEAFTVSLHSHGSGFDMTMPDKGMPAYLLWYAMSMFFDNGGRECYVVSVGTCQQPASINHSALLSGLSTATQLDDATLLLVPEAVNLAAHEYAMLSQMMLSLCERKADRFAIIDLYAGDTLHTSATLTDCRGYLGANALEYGACYYPFLQTIYCRKIASDLSNITVSIDDQPPVSPASLQQSHSSAYVYLTHHLHSLYVTLPPSAAVAGAYVRTDHSYGVWKAPANLSLTGVIQPAVNIDAPLQETLNSDTATGKSINAIRNFAGKGILIWGARTLAGNDHEWRYVPVKRLVMVIEESIKKSARWVEVESNNADTWSKLTTMVENYLQGKWQQGALVGSKPSDAFFVKCGYNLTMTVSDIQNGYLKMDVGIAPTRPAEFTVLRMTFKLRR